MKNNLMITYIDPKMLEELSDWYVNVVTEKGFRELGVEDEFLYLKVDGHKVGEVSDGYHTFNELYHHRAILFASILELHPEAGWKSKLHADGTMYDGMFVVGMNTPWGQATYHYDMEPYWNYFHVKEIDQAPEFDGHTPEEALERIRRYCVMNGSDHTK